jgi:hypothetical protein
MHWILILPDIQPARYPANPKAGYRTSGKGRIPDIRPDTGYPAGYRISGRIPDIRPDSWLNYIYF